MAARIGGMFSTERLKDTRKKDLAQGTQRKRRVRRNLCAPLARDSYPASSALKSCFFASLAFAIEIRTYHRGDDNFDEAHPDHRAHNFKRENSHDRGRGVGEHVGG